MIKFLFIMVVVLMAGAHGCRVSCDLDGPPSICVQDPINKSYKFISQCRLTDSNCNRRMFGQSPYIKVATNLCKKKL